MAGMVVASSLGRTRAVFALEMGKEIKKPRQKQGRTTPYLANTYKRYYFDWL